MPAERPWSLATLILLALSTAAGAAPFANGSFESPDASGGDRLTPAAGAFLVGTSGSAIYSKASPNHANDFVKPSNGNQYLALNLTGGSNNTGGVQQQFDTIVGQAYTVSFDFAAISNGDNSTQSASYEVDSGATAASNATGAVLTSGTVSKNTTGFANLTLVPFTTTTFNFTADNATSTIRFVSLTSPPSHNAFGPVVDNVVITPAPEPASLSLLGLAAGALLRRSRRAERV